MKNSGCPVPDYMLAMKDRSKREKKRLYQNKEKREDICRSHTYGVVASKRRTKKPMLKKRFTKNDGDDSNACETKINYVSLKRTKTNQMQNGKSKKKRVK